MAMLSKRLNRLIYTAYHVHNAGENAVTVAEQISLITILIIVIRAH